jgi:ADP-glucose pyrophosphorylase
VQDFEERAYWRDVGTLSALAAAQQDAMGVRPRFNLWNSRWPIRGEHEAVMLAKVRDWEAEAEQEARVTTPSSWRAARRDLHTDERVQPS